jgi:esterase/lipase superfamily enzyme
VGHDRGCAAFIDEGRARVIAVDSIDWQSWTNQAISPADRARRHDAYDRYLAGEVSPFLRGLTGWETAWATGASMAPARGEACVRRRPRRLGGRHARRHARDARRARRQAIPAIVDEWGDDVNHDWPWWRKMLPHYLDRLGV